jgi:N-acyl homoserine lactone hydrolase
MGRNAWLLRALPSIATGCHVSAPSYAINGALNSISNCFLEVVIDRHLARLAINLQFWLKAFLEAVAKIKPRNLRVLSELRDNAAMNVHAIQTGSVRIKTAQVEGRGHGWRRRLAIFTDRQWTEWLPTYTWVIEHREGVIVVDTGQGVHLLETGFSLHPYVRWEVEFRIDREEEIGLQLSALGIGPRDVKRVVLTHLHMDHDGGLAHFPHSEILVSQGELRVASGWGGRMRGYLPNRWPSWFDPTPLNLSDGPFGPFGASKRLTKAGNVIAVATPGHTAHHISIMVQEDDTILFLAGDASYNQRLMPAGKWTASARMIAFPAQP